MLRREEEDIAFASARIVFSAPWWVITKPALNNASALRGTVMVGGGVGPVRSPQCGRIRTARGPT